MMNKQRLVVGLLLERLADSKVGILVKGINAASKKLISRKSSKIKGFRFHGGIAQLGARTTSTPHPQ